MLLSILILLILILVIPTAYAAIIGAPPAPTDRTRIEKIVRVADIKPNQKFYELGSGTGRVMVLIAKMSRAEVIGFELSPVFYLISLLNLKIHRVKKYKLYLKNFFNANLKEADIVFCFLMPNAIEKLKEKLKRELKAETKVISYVFEIKGWTPCAIIKDNKKLPVYIYQMS